jgi:formate hydrogenlyase transcriptional activator
MNILYVEDDPRDADVTVRVLRKIAPNLRVETVSTIQKAIERLDRLADEPLDLALLDVHLRDGDGISLLGRIRERSLPLAVVVLTGMGDEETAVAALKARADDYVVKRKDYLERLPVILESALNHYRADAARKSHPLKVLYAEYRAEDSEATRRHFAVHADHIHLKTVSTGADALLALRSQDSSQPFDVVLLAYDFPELNPLELLKEMRQTHGLDTPVVVLCVPEYEDLARYAITVGAISYLVKNPGYLHRLPSELEEAHFHADLLKREGALRESQEHLQRAQRAANVGTWEWDIDSGVSRWSEGIYDLLGIKQGSVEPSLEKFVGFIHPDDRERALANAQNVVARGGEYYDEFAVVLPDGTTKWLASKGRVERRTDGKPARMLGVNFDITERKRSEERFRRYFELPLIGMAITSPDRRFIEVNQKLCEMLGYPMAELNGKSWVDVSHPDDVAENVRLLEQTLSGQTEGYSMDKRFIHRDGHVVYASISARCVRHADRSVDNLVLIIQDITERKRAEEKLEKALAEVQLLKDRLHDENIYLREEIRVARDFGEIVGRSASLQRVLRLAEQVAPLDTTVLLLGETGTGKELLAHAIHKSSTRNTRPLVMVNCATLPTQLIESELFGHEKGAFTGALARRAGRFEIANGGTIFLDEVGELPLELQTKLLRVLQEGEFEHLGSSRTMRVDVRVIAATNRNLEDAVREGLFRSDLFYRLNIFPLTLPPLRERPEDLPMLVMHFVKQLSIKLGKEIEAIPQDTMAALQAYPWPGNIRELRNVIERAAIITQGPKLRLLDSLEYLPLREQGPLQTIVQQVSQPAEPVAGDSLEESQYKLILHTLEKTYWRVEGPDGAAALLKVHPNTLRSRMRKLGITKPKFKTQP